MKRLTATIAAGLLLAVCTLGAAADEAEDVRAVISAQLEAFKAGDAKGAYEHAAPGIRRQFPTAERFMEMVERGYGPVYRSSSVTFGEMETRGDLIRQDVRLSDPRGLSHVATYLLQRQEDGSFKIVAVSMRRSNDIAT